MLSTELRVLCRLYIDQPGWLPVNIFVSSGLILLVCIVGVGYSYGQRNVTGAKEAAVAVWNMLQIFYSDPTFSSYANNELALWTES